MLPKNKKYNSFFIIVFNGAALAFAIIMLIRVQNKILIYNFIRSIIFSLISIYLHLKPSKVNFTDSLLKSGSENSGDLNVFITRFLSIAIAVLNACISAALYFD